MNTEENWDEVNAALGWLDDKTEVSPPPETELSERPTVKIRHEVLSRLRDDSKGKDPT